MTERPRLPAREGLRPRTSTRIPHKQLDQQPSDSRHLNAILAQALAWPHVAERESEVSVEGARALTLNPASAGGPAEAFMAGREFCHGHAQGDFSLHATLPVRLAGQAERAGWAEPHFLARTGQLPATVVMLYAPRDETERDVILRLVRASYRFARNPGRPAGSRTAPGQPRPRTSKTTASKGDTMKREDMDRLIDQHLQAENNGDTDGCVAMYTDDVIHDVVGNPAGPLTGPAAAKGFYDYLTANVTGEAAAVNHAWYGEDFCVVEHQWNGHVPGEFLGVPGHGKPVSFRMLHIWEFKDGRMSRENVWLDGSAIIAQLTREPTR